MQARHEEEIFEAKRKLACNQGYERWRNDTLVKATIDSFEAEDDEDAATFENLLRDAYNKGFALGGATSMINLLDIVLNNKFEEKKQQSG